MNNDTVAPTRLPVNLFWGDYMQAVYDEMLLEPRAGYPAREDYHSDDEEDKSHEHTDA